MLCWHGLEILDNILNRETHVFILHWALQIYIADPGPQAFLQIGSRYSPQHCGLPAGGPHLAMAEPGEQLPEEVLALIFRHLPLPDRAAAARVCRAWAAAATCSAVWHDTSIR